VFITAYDDASTRERVHRAGAVGYLRKPFDQETLLDTVTGAIGQDASP
jgi:FixJ family two-component response regulator